MSLSKTTELGDVSISDQVIAKIITGIMSAPEYSSVIWPATSRGRQIGSLRKMSDAEFASNIESSYTDEEGFVLEFSVIVKFGESIKELTRSLSDRLKSSLEYSLGISPSEITINIAGVKSKQTAKRNIKAVYRYGNN